jgi:hypothetical protein
MQAVRSFAFLGAGTPEAGSGKVFYKSFACRDGRSEERVSVGDAVYCYPEDIQSMPPYIGLVTAAWLSQDGAMYFRTQWFYRAEEIKRLIADDAHRQVGAGRGRGVR